METSIGYISDFGNVLSFKIGVIHPDAFGAYDVRPSKDAYTVEQAAAIIKEHGFSSRMEISDEMEDFWSQILQDALILAHRAAPNAQ